MKRILLTGASGFVGSHILSHLLKETDYNIVCICSWKHKGEPYRILDDGNYQKNKDRVQIITHDLTSPFTARQMLQLSKGGIFDAFLNIASESHVNRSIVEPELFIKNNIEIMLTMLELARYLKPKLFLQFSTDEVYGQAPKGLDHKEWSPIIPSNPYSASKACQEAIAISYWRTYSIPVIITNAMNIFGEMQDSEKFIPLCIDKIQKNEEITIHGYPDEMTAGSRFYIHVRNVAGAVLFIMNNVKPEMYPQTERPVRFNIVGEKEVDNLTMAKLIAEHIGKPLKYKIVDFHSSRPGHDCRYALDGSLLKELGWSPKVSFEESLKKVVEWELKNK